jgi:Na+/melibiose symporter-like transporter
MVGLAFLLCVPVWTWCSKKYGKQRTYMGGGACLACSIFFLYVLDESNGTGAGRVGPLVISTCFGACLAVPYLIPYSMLPDVIELDELKTGQRREGVFTGFFVVFMKLAVTGGLALSNFILAAAGYSAPVSTCGHTGDGSTSTSTRQLLLQPWGFEYNYYYQQQQHHHHHHQQHQFLHPIPLSSLDALHSNGYTSSQPNGYAAVSRSLDTLSDTPLRPLAELDTQNDAVKHALRLMVGPVPACLFLLAM